ncbi:Exosome complex component rrp43 [Neolecta irregularis DAH-3]|uniref:Ribosomal RNA-processing protein 43 n=1 Tax=Neolecta irregularis (strain DAH-3) TaxID=1198029 RepID=A0A1U7LV10_NEOID|nr:Exosome complex component rrp43 [Neolecta irregularis DAH-3]|eukprot:OLL26459.1 Exosome complex component rrp43 [Neolecta irregularis DAH-3]
MTDQGASYNLDLSAEAFKCILPEEYQRKFIENGIRPDGRKFSESRSLTVQSNALSDTNGSCLVRCGSTIFICGIRAETAEPDIQNPNQGWVVPNVDFSPMCSPKLRPGPPSDMAQAMSERIYSIFQSSKLLSLADLCIEPGKVAWVLYAEITCLNLDGNAFDSAWLAFISALESTTLPIAYWNEDTQAVLCKEGKRPVRLNRILYSFSYGLFKGKHVLADLTEDEEDLISENVTIMHGSDGQLAHVSFAGSNILPDILSNCIALTHQRYNHVQGLVS